MSPRSTQITAVLGATAMLMALFGPAAAAPPAGTPGGAIAVEVANGFEVVSEQRRPDGTVLSTFASPTETVRTIAWDEGASISFFPGEATAATSRAPAHGSLLVGSGTERPKDPADVNRLRDSGRTVIGDLVALGMPRGDAERIFGDMDTMDGSNPYTGEPAAKPAEESLMTLASSTTPHTGSASSAVPSSSTTPYDIRCFNVSAASGKIEGYGCTTYYLVHQSGLDWWFNVKYKFSARSTDTSLFPVRLKGVAWRAQWSSGNIVYDWEPDSTQPINSGCITVTPSISGGYASISISGTVCPSSHGPWQISSIKSGALWQGAEQGTAWEVAVGVQKTKNPAGVATNYYSYYWLEW